MNRRIFFASLAMASAAILFQGSTAHAASTLAIGGFDNALVPSTATGFTTSSSVTTGFSLAENPGTGIYSGIAGGTVGSGYTINLSNLSAFTFSIGGYTFVSNSNSYLDSIETLTPTSLAVYLRGDFGGTDVEHHPHRQLQRTGFRVVRLADATCAAAYRAGTGQRCHGADQRPGLRLDVGAPSSGCQDGLT